MIYRYVNEQIYFEIKLKAEIIVCNTEMKLNTNDAYK